MNYEDLINLLVESFKTGVPKNITADKLREALIKVVEFANITRGDYQGTATPSTNTGTPSTPVYYFAGQSGVYINFGGITVDSTQGINILSYSGSAWSKAVVPIDLAGYAQEDLIYAQKSGSADLAFTKPGITAKLKGDPTYMSSASDTPGVQQHTEFGRKIAKSIGSSVVNFYSFDDLFTVLDDKAEVEVFVKVNNLSGTPSMGLSVGSPTVAGQKGIHYRSDGMVFLQSGTSIPTVLREANPNFAYSSSDVVSLQLKKTGSSAIVRASKNGVYSTDIADVEVHIVGKIYFTQRGSGTVDWDINVQRYVLDPVVDKVPDIENSLAVVKQTLGELIWVEDFSERNIEEYEKFPLVGSLTILLSKQGGLKAQVFGGGSSSFATIETDVSFPEGRSVKINFDTSSGGADFALGFGFGNQ